MSDSVTLGTLESAVLGADSENDSVLSTDGKTAHGNDPTLEMHYVTELDPNRQLPATGYPYLDRLERVRSEIARAAVEGNEPDLENPGPNAGNPLKSAAELSNPLNVSQSSQLAFAEPAVVLDEEARDTSQNGLGPIVDPNHLTPKAEAAEPATERQEELTAEANDSQTATRDGNGTPTFDVTGEKTE